MRVRTRGVASLLLLLATACGPRAPAPPRSPFVLVTIDTLPAMRVGCYGCPTVRTPTLDRLARRGIQAMDAISPAPLTAPSHTTILTGLDPPQHGVRENAMFRMADSLATVAQLLPTGVRKGAFVGAFPLAARFGLARGFDVYDDDFTGHTDRRRPPERKAAAVLAAAAAWLAKPDHGRRPFLWVHLFDPHYPYEAPSPWPRAAGTIPGAGAYEGEVAYTDRELGKFLSHLETGRASDDPTVLVVADHGESFGAHSEVTHSLFVYDATQRVPMIFAGPKVSPRLETAQRRLADVTPTILSAYGRPKPAAMNGTPLTGAPPTAEAYVETEHTELMLGWAPLFGVRTPQWKYIRAPRPELYDLVRDPAELNNVFAANPEVVSRLSALVDDVLATQGEFRPSPLDGETAERLRSLGYVSQVAQPKRVEHGMDPKDGAPGQVALFYGEESYSRGDFGAAQRYLLEAIRLDPTNKEAYSFLSGTYHGLGRYDLAADYARRSLELEPHISEAPVHATLGECLLLLGRPADALPHLEKAREHRAGDPKLDRLIEEAKSRLR